MSQECGLLGYAEEKSKMKTVDEKKGFTLTELLVVVAVISLLVGIGLTATKGLLNSFESSKGVKNILNAALSSARAMALKNAQYAGLRFQQDADGNQYLVLVVNDPGKTGLVNGFCALEGRKPIRLPADSCVADLIVRTNNGPDDVDAEEVSDRPITDTDLNDNVVGNLDADGKNIFVTDMTSFSIIFNSSGKVIVHKIRVRNDDGVFRPDPLGTNSGDMVFNGQENVRNNNMGMFVQDDYAYLGLGAEKSRTHFIIYSKTDLKSVDPASRYTGYLQDIEKVYVNPYTGELVSEYIN